MVNSQSKFYHITIQIPLPVSYELIDHQGFKSQHSCSVQKKQRQLIHLIISSC